MRTMLVGLLEELVAPKTCVTDEELRAQGFDPEAEAPEPDDFW